MLIKMFDYSLNGLFSGQDALDHNKPVQGFNSVGYRPLSVLTSQCLRVYA